MLIFACICILILNPVFLIIAVGIYRISIIVPAILKNKIISLNKNVIEANTEFTKSCDEIFNGFTTIKSFNIMKTIFKIHRPVIQKVGKENMCLNFWISVTNAVLAFLGIFMTLFVFIIGGWYVVSGTLTAGALVALSELLAYTIEPITGIIGAQNSINSVKNVLDSCKQILAYLPKKPLTDVAKESGEGVITVKNLDFCYADNTSSTLDNVSFSFKKGKKYAIIGSNGSGKSTFLKVLAGIHEPQNGELFLSGQRYGSLSEAERQEKLIYMEQNSYIFNLSIEENITLKRDIPKSALNDVMEDLELTAVARMHGQENISVQTLSGGEQQRISLARCILTMSNADVFFADEPTAAMDACGRASFYDIMQSFQNKTCIVVTHNLDETLRIYDEILVMDNGRLRTHGTYDDLVNSGQIPALLPLAI